ncbi:hypothetical protein IWT25_02375 [Secundilactobacillus pentosiphilus]|uniref:Uncharacterized protein n=1 Tax=Secundilactobacillus pentosiphilus TaxID=1714682 RepID=A0A1Z5IZ27_9LACO|nr:hypothetical protein [Secundilactobacillus pentosiphilus]GAX07027.1 hypothetical protein IWT25_02375 [Secundilactobacillus pentosiphilus]
MLDSKSRVTRVEVEKVICVTSLVGRGTEESPLASIKEYFDTDGKKIASQKLVAGTDDYLSDLR